MMISHPADEDSMETPRLSPPMRRGVLQPSLLEMQRLKGGYYGSRRIAWARSQSWARGLGYMLYATLGVCFGAGLVFSLVHYPLYPPRPHSVEWLRVWLLATVADYYGAALCLCGVIFATEVPLHGLLWSVGCCLFGTPCCCAYVMIRLLRHGTLRLVSRPRLPLSS